MATLLDFYSLNLQCTLDFRKLAQKAIFRTQKHVPRPQAPPSFAPPTLQRATLKSWVGPGDEAKEHGHQCITVVSRVSVRGCFS